MFLNPRAIREGYYVFKSTRKYVFKSPRNAIPRAEGDLLLLIEVPSPWSIPALIDAIMFCLAGK